ncbi:hypothetical protein FB45DRAFT_980468 [Roridomyces roridus]|uniref:Tetraspanin Tsp2 n=1 Tax=Roridomyces roridus TaxID=1738132 RepID=A0AAD7BKB9_9AGAR|nr:hypothetical protein FB45DRAFT_980468 [Roridomyces roridus]
MSAGDRNSTRPSSAFGLNPDNRASTSLSVNYVPSKFSDVLSTGGGARRRRPKAIKQMDNPAMARGGGVDAFRRGEARMPEDRDDLNPSAARKGWMDRSETGSRWTRFKWIIFVFNAGYSALALGALVFMLLFWLDILEHSDVLRVANRTQLIFTTVAASWAVLTSIFGWAGILLNNRSILAFYTFFLWISFALLTVPGYLTYRQYALNLQGKLNFGWSELYEVDGRRRIQNALGCCGYFNPFVEASISSTCYARSVLPGCKGLFFRFEHRVLRRWYVVVFSLVGYNISTIVAALLCVNHVTYRFGKGMMPKAYRLNEEAVAVIMESYAAQLAEQYGPEAAALVMAHSRAASTATLGDMVSMPYAPDPRRSAVEKPSAAPQGYGAIVERDTTI